MSSQGGTLEKAHTIILGAVIAMHSSDILLRCCASDVLHRDLCPADETVGLGSPAPRGRLTAISLIRSRWDT